MERLNSATHSWLVDKKRGSSLGGARAARAADAVLVEAAAAPVTERATLRPVLGGAVGDGDGDGEEKRGSGDGETAPGHGEAASGEGEAASGEEGRAQLSREARSSPSIAFLFPHF